MTVETETMTTGELATEMPELAVARAYAGRMAFMRNLRGLRDDVISTYPDEAFERGYVKWRRVPWWSELMVSDPTGIKRILLDNGANYVKSDLFRALAA